MLDSIMFLTDACGGLLDIVILLRKVVNVLFILIPIGLIMFGLIDLGKAVIAGKEDEMKKAQGLLLKRFIYAIAVFLVYTLVTFALSFVAEFGGNAWSECWKTAGKGAAVENGGVEIGD